MLHLALNSRLATADAGPWSSDFGLFLGSFRTVFGLNSVDFGFIVACSRMKDGSWRMFVFCQDINLRAVIRSFRVLNYMTSGLLVGVAGERGRQMWALLAFCYILAISGKPNKHKQSKDFERRQLVWHWRKCKINQMQKFSYLLLVCVRQLSSPLRVGNGKWGVVGGGWAWLGHVHNKFIAGSDFRWNPINKKLCCLLLKIKAKTETKIATDRK